MRTANALRFNAILRIACPASYTCHPPTAAISAVQIKSYIEMKRLRSLAKTRPALVIIPYIVLPIIIPVLVPVVILARMLGAYVSIFGVFMEMNQARSLAHGFRYVLGLVYRYDLVGCTCCYERHGLHCANGVPIAFLLNAAFHAAVATWMQV